MKGKVCIVTGAGSGIGRATAVKLAGEGATVVLVGRTASRLDDVRLRIEAEGGAAAVHPCDVADLDAVRRIPAAVLETHGRIDVLVNNAGASSRNRTTLTTTPDEAEAMVGVNLMGPFFLTQGVLPHMLDRGSGTIVNVSSLAATHPSRLGGAFYTAVKAALRSFTLYLNVELENTGIRACSVLPGEVDTPTLDNRPVPPDAGARATMLAPQDVADAIVLTIAIPDRALVEEIVMRPRHKRDLSHELMPAV